jgi:hypothetical protein
MIVNKNVYIYIRITEQHKITAARAITQMHKQSHNSDA